MMKAAIIGGGGESEATYALTALGRRCDSPPSAYALAIAGLVMEDDDLATRGAEGMAAGGEAFLRTAPAVRALVDRGGGAYREALTEIVRSFEERDGHLTGVPIADTAIMLECLAQRRGMATGAVASPLLPAP